jgi:hypothetical protein
MAGRLLRPSASCENSCSPDPGVCPGIAGRAIVGLRITAGLVCCAGDVSRVHRAEPRIDFSMPHELLFIGCLLVLGAWLALVAAARTMLLGLNFLNLFAVGSATLGSFTFGVLVGDPMAWFTPEHNVVIGYSIAGLLAMLAGIFVAWMPLIRRGGVHGAARSALLAAPHLNERLGWVTLAVGVSAQLLYSPVYLIPTLSTAVNALASLGRVGLFIMAWSALRTGKWPQVAVGFGVYMTIMLVASVTGGYSFIRIDTLIPMAAILFLSRGLRPLSIAVIPLVFAVILVATSGWMGSRDLIREGSLENLPLDEKISRFLDHYAMTFESLTRDDIMQTVNRRVDGTELLAAQVGWQPDHEPFAYGATVLGAAYNIIPRAVWPEKPEVAGGSAFVERYTGLSWGESFGTSVGLPYPFELYANGGALAVVLGLFAIGYLGGVMERRLFAKPLSLGAFWALAVATAVVCDGGQRVEVVLPALVAAALSAYALGWAIRRYDPSLEEHLLRGSPADVPSELGIPLASPRPGRLSSKPGRH